MSLSTVSRRDSFDGDEQLEGPPTTGGLVFALLTLMVLGSLLSLALLYMRRKRRAQKQALLPVHSRRGHQRSITITNAPRYHQTEKVFVYDEKMNLIGSSSGRPGSPVPEIRITFPDEEDRDSGEKKSGRVVRVIISENGHEGLEPLQQDQLPAYQKEDAGKFASLDLNRMGGLREGSAPRWS